MNNNNRPRRLRDQFRDVIRVHHYSIRTEKTYWYWIRYFIRFHHMRHPAEMAEAEVSAFLTWLATTRHVAASTQNQALNALVFLYKRVLNRPLDQLEGVQRAKRPARLPVVLTHAEAMSVIGCLPEPQCLIVSLIYGSGLRVSEAARLRVKDIDLSRRTMTVRRGKGNKDRTTLLPDSLRARIRDIMDERARAVSRTPVLERLPVSLPHALAHKYPSAATSPQWQWLFPSSGPSPHPDTGQWVLHHLHISSVQKAVKRATAASGISKPATSHSFRHSFATQLLSNGTDIRTVQELLGHKDLNTTKIYTHVLGEGFAGVRSPLEM